MQIVDDIISELKAIADPEEKDKVRRFYKGRDSKTTVLGVSIGKVFPIAKAFRDAPLNAVERLLKNPNYEVRMAAVSILDFKARKKNLSDKDRKALFDFYMANHDRIDNWDLVDRAAPHVVGEYLVDCDKTKLDKLASSDDPNSRRTAIVCTHAFLKRGKTAETFRVAAMLADDPDEYVQKAVASWVREAGKQDEKTLIDFLKKHRSKLARPTLMEASKRLPAEIRADLTKKG